MANMSRLEFFPAHLSLFSVFELHFSGSALSTRQNCRTEFRGQPARFRSPALVGNIASVVLLRQPWAAIATVGKFLRRRENATCAQVAAGAGAPAPMPQRRNLSLILTAEFNPEQFRPVPENRACPPARQSEFNTDAHARVIEQLSVCCQSVVWRPVPGKSVKCASSLPVQLYIYRTLSLRRVIYEYSCSTVSY